MSGNGHALQWQETEAGRELQHKFAEADTLSSLTRLLDRIDSLENTVEKLTQAVEQGPGMVAMVTDMVDEGVRTARSNGVEVDERLKNALVLAEKLTSPQMMDRLDQLFDMVDRLPGMVSMVTDMADDGMRRAKESGLDVEERLSNALVLAERLTAPETVRQLEGALDLAQRSQGLAAMTADILDEAMAEAMQKGLDPAHLLRKGVDIAAKTSNFLSSEEINSLMESGVLGKETLAVISAAGSAMVAAQNAPERSVGLFGLMRAMRDPQVQVAMGFLMEFAKQFGNQLKQK